MTTSDHLTAQQRAALDAAAELARAGVPVFVASADDSSSTGFALPARWEQTAPDPAVVERWAPGMALCAVMGCGLDLLDVDPRNGGDPQSLDGAIPTSYATATTPSGGFHSFVRSLDAGSRDNVTAGIDVKGGLPDGTGRGFAFLAPTVRRSKVTGEPEPYAWASPPDVAALRAALAQPGRDTSGAALAARVRELRAGTGAVPRSGGPDWYRAFLANREPQSAPAAERAIAEKLADVTGWTVTAGDGFRTVLMRAAMTLGGYVGGGWLDESDAWSQLESACSQVWGAPDEDDRRWIGQGLSDGAEQPFHVYTADDEQRFGEAAQAVAAQRVAPAWSPYRGLGVEAFDPAWCAHDQEFAEAVAGRALPVLRYAADAGSWLVREAERWREREDLSGWAVAIVARLMPLGQTPVPKDHSDRTEAHWQAVRRARFMASSGSGAIERKLRSIVRGGDHPASVELGRLDAEPEVMWAGGLPFDLRASREVPTLAALDPATPHLRSCSVAPEVRDTPRWDAFVAAVLPDPEVRRWALRVLAVALTGYPDAVLPVLYGPERTGKTALVTLLVDVLGTYGHAADPRLLGGADNAHASIVYALKGRRLSFVDEGPRRGHLAAERLKQLTGGGQLTGNAMRSNPVTFGPTHTLVMTTNDEPPITDPALRARVRIIPCDADTEQVRRAREALTPAAWAVEAPGVLAAMMREAAGWLDDRSSAAITAGPETVREQAVEIAQSQDPVREWVELCTVPVEPPGTPGRELFRRFVAWHETQPHYRRQSAPSESIFGRTLTDMGFPWSWGGERGKTKCRPLSVMDGGPGPLPNLPTSGPGGIHNPAPNVTQTTPSADTLPTPADTSSTEVSAPENRRSEHVSNCSADTADTLSRSMSCKDVDYSNRATPGTESQGNVGEPGSVGNPAPSESENRSSQPVPTPSPTPSPKRRQRAAAGLPPVDNPVSAGQHASVSETGVERPEWLAGRDLSQKVTVDEAAARAERDGTSRTDARKALGVELRAARKTAEVERKAADRLAAIADASGEHVGLPGVVDRAGHVLGHRDGVTLDQAAAVVRAALARAGALTVDVETSGYPVGHEHYRLRTVQLGDETAVAIFDADDPEQTAAVAELLGLPGPDGAPARLHAHSATADLVPLAVAGLIDPETAWPRMHDTVIPAKLADPQSTGSDPGLKQLAGTVLGAGSVAPAADAARDALWKAGGWSQPKMFADQVAAPIERNGWAQVDSGCVTMLRYAGSDVLDTAALPARLPAPAPAVLDRERLAQRMTARITHRGLPIDGRQVAALTAQHEAGKAEAGGRVRAFGVDNPGSDDQVGRVVERLGATLPRTKTGKPSVKAGVLEPLRKAPDELGAFVSAVLDYRHADTALGLFLRPYALLGERGDGRVRPTVYTIGTDTGRMCLPTDHGLVTPDGPVKAADVRAGMTTLDAAGRWVRVLAVHRYADQPVQTITNGGIELACTPEHRWSTTRDHEAAYAARKGRPAPPRELRRLDDHPRLRVHLAPDVEPFDFESRALPADTDGQRFAALVGMLVTDGRCVESDEPGVGMRAHVYQTERKFLAEFRRVIPDDAVMYDRLTTSGDGHHEIRIRTRWLRPRLADAGLRTGALLRESPDLYRWAAGLPLDELRAFLAAAWLADGTLAQRSISCGSENLRAVLALAAYRLGVVAYTHELPPSEWSNGTRTVLSFRRPVVTVRKSEHGTGRADVWCVTTETGTFTAAGPRGTVYLTGNSCVRPNLQQLPRSGGVRACITADPGHVLVSADFSGVEIRVAAALSQDPTLLGLLADGRDLHAEVARQVWGESAGKAERYIAKRIVFGRLYGGGLATLAEQAGVDQGTVQRALDVLDAITPQLTAWSGAIRDAVKAGRTHFPTYAGRVIHLTRDTPHKAPNYCVTPDTPILRSDLRHVPAAEIRVGDRLVAFDEYPANGGGRNDYRRMRTAVVEAASTVRKPSVTVRTADGKATTCSTDHLWLARPAKQPGHDVPRTRWVKAEDLRPGDALLSVGTWGEATCRTAGYLAGLYDGEGSLQARGAGHRSTGLAFSQLRGPVMDAFRAGMDALDLPYGYYRRSPQNTSPTDTVFVNGVRKIMRTLGTLQPERFRDRFESVYEGAAITAGLTESVAVTGVDDAGEIELTSIQTSTRTLVANGYLSHNCIQGSARELLVDALQRWAHTPWGDATLLPVHDELVVAVPEADADAATEQLVECMRGELHGVPIVAEASAPSRAWSDSA